MSPKRFFCACLLALLGLLCFSVASSSPLVLAKSRTTSRPNSTKPSFPIALSKPASLPSHLSRSDLDGQVVVEVMQALLTKLGVANVDASCIEDVGGAALAMRHFQKDLHNGNFTEMVKDFEIVSTTLSASIVACNYTQADFLRTELTLLSAAVRAANVTVQKVVTVVTGIEDIFPPLKALADELRNGADSSAIADTLLQILNDWSHIKDISSLCVDQTDSSLACKAIDGILKTLQAITSDIAPCKAGIGASLSPLRAAVDSFTNLKNYTKAVDEFAAFLELLSEGIKNDACGLKPLYNVIVDLYPKLATAKITIDAQKVIHIIVGRADVYNTLYQAVNAFLEKKYSVFGNQLGILLQELRVSDCSSVGCVIIQTLVGTAQLNVDLKQCVRYADVAFSDFSSGLDELRQGQLKGGFGTLGRSVKELAAAAETCKVTKVGDLLSDLANKLTGASRAGDRASKVIEEITLVLVGGADVTTKLNTLISNFESKNYQATGGDLLILADTISTDFNCKSVACEFIQGLLESTGKGLVDLKPCAEKVKAVDVDLVAGAASLSERSLSGVVGAVDKWSSAVLDITGAVEACGLQDEMKVIQKEIGVLGIASVLEAKAGGVDAWQVLVHGADVFKEMESITQSFASHDIRGAGAKIESLVSEINTWTNGHACEDDFCYVVIGMLEFAGEVEGDIKKCGADFKEAFVDLKEGSNDLTDYIVGSWWHFTRNVDLINKGIGELGQGVLKIADGVKDCHLQELSALLEKLGLKLGLAPEISILSFILHILIEGRDIATEVGQACVDFSKKNWAGFGFNIAKLLKTLLDDFKSTKPLLLAPRTNTTVTRAHSFNPFPNVHDTNTSLAKQIHKIGSQSKTVVFSASV